MLFWQEHVGTGLTELSSGWTFMSSQTLFDRLVFLSFTTIHYDRSLLSSLVTCLQCMLTSISGWLCSEAGRRRSHPVWSSHTHSQYNPADYSITNLKLRYQNSASVQQPKRKHAHIIMLYTARLELKLFSSRMTTMMMIFISKRFER